MQVQHFRFRIRNGLPWTAHAFLVLSIVLTSGCDPQVPGSEKSTKLVANSEEVGEEGGVVSIDNGSQVSIPPGVLAAGTDVRVATTEQPAEFGQIEGVGVASKPISIAATGPDGQPLDAVTSPMTLNLPLTGTALALLQVEQSYDNLCVLLKSVGGALYVWRRAQVQLDEAQRLATIQSLNFGTFQMVYCGNKKLSGFTEAASGGLTGEASYTLSMTVPSSFRDLGHGKLCQFLIRIEQDGDDCEEDSCGSQEGEDQDEGDDFSATIVGSSDNPASKNTDQTVELSVVQSDIIDDKEFFAGVIFQDSDTTCSWSAGTLVDGTTTLGGNKGLLAFPVSPQNIRDGVTGTLGENGVYKTMELSVQIGAPGNIATATPSAEEACLRMDFKDGGHAALPASFDSAGLISGQSVYKMLAAVGTGSTAKPSFTTTVGEGCLRIGDRPETVDTATGKPYQIEHREFTVDDDLWISPITLQLNQTIFFAVADKNGCLTVHPKGLTGHPIAETVISLGTASYNIYIPFLHKSKYQDSQGRPLYDLKIAALDGDRCGSNSLQDFTAANRPLSDSIEVPDL